MANKNDESFWRTVATAVVGFIGFWIVRLVVMVALGVMFFPDL